MEEKFLKLTSAAYKALEFFPEDDPLKNRAKDKVLAIMDNLVLHNESARQWLIEDIDLLLGYLKIGQQQGWLSAINYLIISNQYENIKKEIARSKACPEPILLGSASIEKDASAAQKKAEALNSQTSRLSDRQRKILEFLQEKEKVQVMDLQTVLPDVTKRTIRRDLDELLKMGKIARLGEWNQVVYKLLRSPTSQ